MKIEFEGYIAEIITDMTELLNTWGYYVLQIEDEDRNEDKNEDSRSGSQVVTGTGDGDPADETAVKSEDTPEKSEDTPEPENLSPEEAKKEALSLLVMLYNRDDATKGLVKSLLTKYGVKKFSDIPEESAVDLFADTKEIEAA